MAEIAEEFPQSQRPKYRAAVKKFRLPYWDYYRPRGHGKTTFPGVKFGGGKTSFDWDFSIPQIFTLEKVMIRTPENDELHLADNPLNWFSFPKTGSIPEDEWSILGVDVCSLTRSKATKSLMTLRSQQPSPGFKLPDIRQHRNLSRETQIR